MRGSEAVVGSRTYVPSACWRRLRGAGVHGDLGSSHHAYRARQGRAGLDCARHPARPGFARVWRPALVPPLGAALKPMARRPLPHTGLPRPQGGRRGGRERGVVGDWAPGSPAEAFVKTAGGGRTHALSEEALGNQNRGRLPPSMTFLASFADCAFFVRLSTPP